MNRILTEVAITLTLVVLAAWQIDRIERWAK